VLLLRSQQLHQVQPVDPRQTEVENQYRGPECDGQAPGGLAITGFSQYSQAWIARQDEQHALAHEFMIFGDDDADIALAHAAQFGLNLMNVTLLEASTSTPGALRDDEELFIRRDLLEFVLAQTPIAVFGNLAVAGVTCAVLSQWEPVTILACWTGAIATLVSVRFLLYRHMAGRVAGLDRSGVEQTERVLTVLVGLTGLTWGFLPWIGYKGEDAFVDLYTVAMLMGMSGGGTPSLSAVPRALKTYLVAALVPFVLRAIQVGNAISVGGCITILLLLAVLWIFGLSTYRSLRHNRVLTLQNSRLAEALRQERDAVRAVMRAKDLYQAGVTHDLRQPVHALALYINYLHSLSPQELTSPRVGEVWDGVQAALRGISGRLTRLLDLSRLESGEVKPVSEDVRLEGLLRSCRSQFAPVAAQKGLELRVRSSRLGVRTDSRMLQSILDNFVSNAIRYTEGGRVLIGVRRRSGHAEIQVYDTGSGIAAAAIPEIFIPYRRFDDRTRDREEGHGLGLALARKQADTLGHVLSVRSVPGKGSCFSVAAVLATGPY
jgi:signal transduction histidine kinase